jgi:hypothetical protein
MHLKYQLLSAMIRLLWTTGLVNSAFLVQPVWVGQGAGFEGMGTDYCYNGAFPSAASLSIHATTTGVIKAFNTAGTIVATVSPGGYIRRTSNIGTSRVISPGSTSTTVVESTTLAQLTILAVYTASDGVDNSASYAIEDPGTNIMFFQQYPSPYNFYRYDYVNKVKTHTLALTTKSFTLLSVGSTVYAMGTHGKILILSKTNLAQVSFFTLTYSVECGAKDDTAGSASIFYNDYGSAAGYVLYKFDTTTQTIQNSIVAHATNQVYSILSIPSTDALLLSGKGTELFMIFSKSHPLKKIGIYLNYATGSTDYIEHRAAALLVTPSAWYVSVSHFYSAS